MQESLKYLWAKTGGDASDRWHPLILHVLDVAASADALMNREPESTRVRMASVLGMKWEQARPWILLIVACHDLGKASPGFQCKWPALVDRVGLDVRSADTHINHAFVSQFTLGNFLIQLGWSVDLAEQVSDATGCHHGERISPLKLEQLETNRRAVGRDEWARARRSLFDALLDVLRPGAAPIKPSLSGPDFILLAGLISFSDWVGSNEILFPFGTPQDCDDLDSWFRKRRVNAERALDSIGWSHREPLATHSRSFDAVFGFEPRPLQSAMQSALDELDLPSLILIEAPMGEGKTEAALFAHLELQRRFGHRGLYMALPTKATGNAMYSRTLAFLAAQSSGRTLDFQLLHGAAVLNDEFQSVRLNGIYDPASGGSVRAREWFTHKKRALLSEYGVGTVDQAIVPILPVRHNFVRLWGLANRVIVFDEIHAYDAYTGTLLVHLLRWLLALGSSVILLSATLPPSIRRSVARMFDTQLPESEAPYPRISTFSKGSLRQRHFECDPGRRLRVRLGCVEPDLSAIKRAIDEQFSSDGMVLALMNTVQRSQDLYKLFPPGESLLDQGGRLGKRIDDGTEVLLFHARFPAEQRQRREEHAVKTFGASGSRTGRKILIATQVAEQSLDLDFDLIITDLAPIDLLLQRAGRLWRHKRSYRPVIEPVLFIAGLAGEEPPPFGRPLWWDSVYREDMLLRTWCVLKGRAWLSLPEQIDSLVEQVYEERGEIPDALRARVESATIDAEGEMTAQRGQANQAIIGFPDDASWNEPERFVLFDEDQPGVHRTLMARTRLSEDSVVCIPVFEHEIFDREAVPDTTQAKFLYRRAINISRKAIVRKVRETGIPSGWEKSALLRGAYPMTFSSSLRWREDPSVRLDEELGLVYELKEVE